MHRIDARRGTENFEAIFPTEFELLTKNHQGGPKGPPSGRGLKQLALTKFLFLSGKLSDLVFSLISATFYHIPIGICEKTPLDDTPYIRQRQPQESEQDSKGH